MHKWKMEPYSLNGEEPYGSHIIDENGRSLVDNDGYFSEEIACIIVEALNKAEVISRLRAEIRNVSIS